MVRDMEDADRRGFYVNAKQCTVYITVKSLNEIEVVHARHPESTTSTSNQGEVRRTTPFAMQPLGSVHTDLMTFTTRLRALRFRLQREADRASVRSLGMFRSICHLLSEYLCWICLCKSHSHISANSGGSASAHESLFGSSLQLAPWLPLLSSSRSISKAIPMLEWVCLAQYLQF